jgi:hypothetical protein
VIRVSDVGRNGIGELGTRQATARRPDSIRKGEWGEKCSSRSPRKVGISFLPSSFHTHGLAFLPRDQEPRRKKKKKK